MDDLVSNAQQALGIALQVLEEMPPDLRPDSNIEDIKGMLAGQSSGRDGFLLRQAAATALIFRIKSALTAHPLPDDRDAATISLNNRMGDFRALLQLVGSMNAETLDVFLVDACRRLRFENRNPERPRRKRGRGMLSGVEGDYRLTVGDMRDAIEGLADDAEIVFGTDSAGRPLQFFRFKDRGPDRDGKGVLSIEFSAE